MNSPFAWPGGKRCLLNTLRSRIPAHSIYVEVFAGNLKEMLRGGSRRPLDTIRELLTITADRLKRVRIEQRDFAELIRRFDSSNTFFYLDPPYVHYQPNGRYDALSAERRAELFDLLATVHGSFLMSFDDCAEVRHLANHHGMLVEAVQTRYNLGSTKESRHKIGELLLSHPSRSGCRYESCEDSEETPAAAHPTQHLQAGASASP